ncbi:putative leader peptide [Streptomyces sp. DSM 44915]|uniref:Leader peptide n=1 Tax=Streptomyces chisholmiae TaxID=3075540 RepID=A0ABU2JVI7_9ACTN|nr:putative leader peptide [Streptomyces sp. DSM 44915]MDT0268992.1 putative leader peptide [Streptomyces sp. DSM 44915]
MTPSPLVRRLHVDLQRVQSAACREDSARR